MPENVILEHADLTARSACFRCWSAKERLAAKIFVMAQALKGLTDQDYTNVNALTQISACYKCEPDAVLDAYEIAIFKTLAIAGGAIGDLSATQIRAASACWTCLDAKAMRAAYLFLLNELIEDTAGGEDES
jgi:ferritin-like metal-binding protein YciE